MSTYIKLKNNNFLLAKNTGLMCGVHVCSYVLVLEDAREVGEVVRKCDGRNSEAENDCQ